MRRVQWEDGLLRHVDETLHRVECGSIVLETPDDPNPLWDLDAGAAALGLVPPESGLEPILVTIV